MAFARRFASFLGLVCALSLPAQQPLAVPSRIMAHIDESQRTKLVGSVHPFATANRDHGVLPDSTPLRRMQILLKRSDDQEHTLQQRIQDLHRPGSSLYHQWLTPDSFGKEFGPSDSDIATLTQWLTSKGFTGATLSPGHQTLEFSGTAGQFRSAFHAEVHRFAAPDGSLRNAVATDPDVPTALAPVFGGFVSTSNFTPRPPHSRRGSVSYNPTTHQAKPDWTQSTNNFLLTPGDFAVQYDLNPVYTAGAKGDGQTIAVINISNVNAYLVSQFRSIFGLPASPLQVIVDGTDPGVDGVNNPTGHNGWAEEAYLDVEWAGVGAPNAQVVLVTAGDTELSDGFSLAAEHAVYNNVAPVMSLSVEECEYDNGGSYNAFLSNLWEQAAAQGITVLVAASDSGSAGCDNFDTQQYATGGQQVNGWASTPYNVAVGGTDFYYSGGTNQLATYWNTVTSSTPTVSIKSVIPEQPWNDTQYGLNLYGVQNYGTNIVAGSGGPSNCAIQTTTGSTIKCSPWPKPAWQTGTGVPADSSRDLPDLSLFAANGYNAASYPACLQEGDCNPSGPGGLQVSGVGGTSASTPAFAGIMALITQKYGRQGQANYVFYPLAAQYPAAFHDITVGTNSVPCNINATSDGYPVKNCIAVTSPLQSEDSNGNIVTEGELGTGSSVDYKAGVGYDLASGLGSVDASVMISDWNKISFGATTTTLTPSATSVTHGTAVTLSGTVANSTSTKPTGQVAVMTSSATVNNLSETNYTLNSGSYSGSYAALPGGTYTVYGRYSGDGLNASSTSTPVSITVTPESSATVLEVLSSYNTVSNGANLVYGAPVSLDAVSASPSQINNVAGCLLGTTTCPAVSAATGTATFTDSGSKLATTPMNANGESAYIYSPAIGSHSVSAAYSGDASYNASSSGTTTFTVGKATPTVTGVLNDYFQAGGATTLSLFVENTADTRGSATPPSGSITISGLPTSVATSAALVAGHDPSYSYAAGIATLAIPATVPAGKYTATITYPGDANYIATTGKVTFTVSPEAGAYPTTTTATVSGTATAGSYAAINATVTTQSGHGNPNEYLLLYSGGQLIDYYLLPGNAVTESHTFYVSATNLIGASDVLTVEYTGDGIFMPSSTTVTLSSTQSDFTLVPAQATITTAAGSSVTDTLNLGSSLGFAGTVNVSCTLSGNLTCAIAPNAVTLTANGTGSSTLTISTSSTTPVGTYNVTVTGTDSTGQYIHTGLITVAVTGGSTASNSFTLGNSGNITIASQGASGSTGISITPSGTFSGSVNLGCAITTTPANAVSTPTCSVTSPITVSAGSTASGTLSINTTAPRSAMIHRESAISFAATGIAVILLFLVLPGSRRRWQTTALGFILLLLGAAAMSGCGGSSSSGNGGGTTLTGGTTTGTYIVTVTATSGAITATTAVTVSVN